MSATSPDLVPFVPEAAGGEGTVFACALCGSRFTHGALVCTGCPLNAGCEVIKCPSCGYQSPRRSRIVDAARRLFHLKAPA
ncbi:MAG TPA: hypothetical protein VFB67_07365 [Candidatus Polarisedimenticolaceae bacterium]|nr:hypothetical protein [Candidatus Polarisedimenticolaceae bacterium]